MTNHNTEQKDPVERVRYARATFGAAEKEAVNDILEREEGLVGSEYTARFESAVADLFDKKYGVMVNSGSSGNLLAVEALDLPAGAEVITPLTTFSTTVAPLVQNDLVPVFVDVDVGSYLINVDQVEDAIGEKTAAILVPSVAGNIPDLPRLRAIAHDYDLSLIEDSADTLGATIRDKPTGAYTDISTTSFSTPHIITAFGGGGMVCFDDEETMQRARKLREWGGRKSEFVDKSIDERLQSQIGDITYDSMWVFDRIGYNLQPLEASAAFGLEQLEKLEKFTERRREVFTKLTEFFSGYDDWLVLPAERDDVETAWLAYPLTLTEAAPFDRVELFEHLAENNVQTRSIWSGNIARHPGFEDIECRISSGTTNADYVMKNGFILPCHPSLTDRKLAYLRETFRDLFADYQ